MNGMQCYYLCKLMNDCDEITGMGSCWILDMAVCGTWLICMAVGTPTDTTGIICLSPPRTTPCCWVGGCIVIPAAVKQWMTKTWRTKLSTCHRYYTTTFLYYIISNVHKPISGLGWICCWPDWACCWYCCWSCCWSCCCCMACMKTCCCIACCCGVCNNVLFCPKFCLSIVGMGDPGGCAAETTGAFVIRTLLPPGVPVPGCCIIIVACCTFDFVWFATSALAAGVAAFGPGLVRTTGFPRPFPPPPPPLPL